MLGHSHDVIRHVDWVMRAIYGGDGPSSIHRSLPIDKIDRARLSSPKLAVLLACGSFNPPTVMHLRMLELAKDQLAKVLPSL